MNAQRRKVYEKNFRSGKFYQTPAVFKLSESDKQAVLNFLKQQEPDAVAAGYTDDEIEGKMTNAPLCAHEYGDYCRDGRDILYFEKYDMPLRSDFLKMVLSI